MLTSRTQDEKIHIARSASKADGPFTCPACGSETVLKKGTHVAHHFAHKKDPNCAYGAGETRSHIDAKYGLYDLFKAHPAVDKVELEWRLEDGCIPDVYIEMGDRRLAIELQHSQQQERETIRRTTRYKELGVAVMWVAVPATQKVNNFGPLQYGDVPEYRPTAMERYFSGLHLGSYFLWRSDTKTLHSATLNKVTRYVDGGEFGNSYETNYKDRRHLQMSQPIELPKLGIGFRYIKKWRCFPERFVAVKTREDNK